MNFIMMIMVTMITIKFIMNLFNNLFSSKNTINNIECGFNNLNNYKMNFSMNFTYIMIVFILFDIEMMTIIPLSMNTKKNINSILTLNLFLMFMMFTTMMEMKNNKITWMN